MSNPELKALEKEIHALKKGLARTGNMRPGTLSVQYRDPEERKTPFHQISYTHKGKGRSEYVRPENLRSVEVELAAYRKFREDVEAIIALSLQASRLRHART
jgi:hypothetical protein